MGAHLPNARCLLCEDEYNFWNPGNEFTQHGVETNQNVFQDGVAPTAQSGQLDLLETVTGMLPAR